MPTISFSDGRQHEVQVMVHDEDQESAVHCTRLSCVKQVTPVASGSVIQRCFASFLRKPLVLI